MVITSSIYGTVNCQCRLSGMPDLTLRWSNPRLIDDASFHPCVRYNRYEMDRVISFVPPDGNFNLMKYRYALFLRKKIIYFKYNYSNLFFYL
jgi:AP-3 complex subunit mu